MKLNAIGISSRDFKKTVEFYTILGFSFPSFLESDGHIEAITSPGSIRLMIDSVQIVRDIIGTDPKPGNNAAFAIEYDSPEEVNAIVDAIKKNNFNIFKAPWDAFWGQRYAIVEDPDGYKVDLYAKL